MAAGHYQRIIDEYFGADEVNAADPADVSGEEAEDAAAGRSSDDDAASGRTRPALDYYSVFRST